MIGESLYQSSNGAAILIPAHTDFRIENRPDPKTGRFFGVSHSVKAVP